MIWAWTFADVLDDAGIRVGSCLMEWRREGSTVYVRPADLSGIADVSGAGDASPNK